MKIKKLIFKVKNMIFRLNFKFASYKKKEKMLRKICYYVGNNTRICNNDFGSEPYMVYIGNDVIVASGVKFIEHDASFYNINRFLNFETNITEKIGPIILRDNAFIGAFSILLPGTDVGKNSIIAAGSVVNKKIPDNEVWGGVPARFIMKTDEYAQKLINRNNNLTWIGKDYTDKEIVLERQKYFFKVFEL